MPRTKDPLNVRQKETRRMIETPMLWDEPIESRVAACVMVRDRSTIDYCTFLVASNGLASPLSGDPAKMDPVIALLRHLGRA